MAIIERGFYHIRPNYFDLLRSAGGYFTNKIVRPYLIIEDERQKGLYWAIPTSSLAHRTQQQVERVHNAISLPPTNIRSSYYAIGTTSIPAVYRVGNILPITSDYIGKPYMSQDKHLVLKSNTEYNELRTKAGRILSDEARHPNKYEQRITDVRSIMTIELALRANPNMQETYNRVLRGDCVCREIPNEARALETRITDTTVSLACTTGGKTYVLIKEQDAKAADELISEYEKAHPVEEAPAAIFTMGDYSR